MPIEPSLYHLVHADDLLGLLSLLQGTMMILHLLLEGTGRRRPRENERNDEQILPLPPSPTNPPLRRSRRLRPEGPPHLSSVFSVPLDDPSHFSFEQRNGAVLTDASQQPRREASLVVAEHPPNSPRGRYFSKPGPQFFKTQAPRRKRPLCSHFRSFGHL